MKYNFEDRLNFYKEEIERMGSILNSLLEIRDIVDYFKKAGKEKNMYIVEMRRIIAMELYNTTKLTKADVATVLNKDHSSVITLMETLPNMYCHDIVKANYKDWIKNNKMPYTTHVTVNFKKGSKIKTSTKASLKLKDL